jgi:hypothetical protein
MGLVGAEHVLGKCDSLVSTNLLLAQLIVGLIIQF